MKNKEREVAIKDANHLPIKKVYEEKYELQYHIDKKQLNKDDKLTAPIKKGEKIGTAEITFEGEKDYGYLEEGKDSHTVELIATEDVDKKNWFMLILGAIGSFFASLFSTIVDKIGRASCRERLS